MNLKQAKYINNERLINLFYGLCDGLNHIHDNNLAHRDLKPHNVLISSMFYKAPELFSPRVGICIDEHADYWSLGCILYALM